MLHTWHDLLFMHWPMPVDALRPLVSSAVELDTFDGQAWVAVVPFGIRGIRLRGCPPMPGVSAFAEVNVRTYVTFRGKPGVWFLSLDADSLFNVNVARLWYRLRYFYAAIACAWKGNAFSFFSRRARPGDWPVGLCSRYRPNSEVDSARPGSLEHWLTERYCLYTSDRRGGLLRAEIHHEPWPLRTAEAEIALNSLPASHGLVLPDEPPLLHYAERIDVAVWSPEYVTG